MDNKMYYILDELYDLLCFQFYQKCNNKLLELSLEQDQYILISYLTITKNFKNFLPNRDLLYDKIHSILSKSCTQVEKKLDGLK